LNYNKSYSFRVFFFIITSIWCAGFSFPPLFENIFFDSLFLKMFYGLFCHQENDKCIFLFENYFLVCSRCAGIYVGVFAASAITLFSNLNIKKNIYLILAIGLLVLDVALNSFSVKEYSKTFAFGTGFLLGSILFLYIHNIIFNKKEKEII